MANRTRKIAVVEPVRVATPAERAETSLMVAKHMRNLADQRVEEAVQRRLDTLRRMIRDAEGALDTYKNVPSRQLESIGRTMTWGVSNASIEGDAEIVAGQKAWEIRVRTLEMLAKLENGADLINEITDAWTY